MALPSSKASFTFNHTGQPDSLGVALQGDFLQIQNKFDSRGEELRVLSNAIITTLKSTVAGDSGAHNIATHQVGDITGTNVYAVLDALNTMSAYEEIIVGTTMYRKFEDGRLEMFIPIATHFETTTSQNGLYVSPDVVVTWPLVLSEVPRHITYRSQANAGHWLGAQISSATQYQCTVTGIGMSVNANGYIDLMVHGFWK